MQMLKIGREVEKQEIIVRDDKQFQDDIHFDSGEFIAKKKQRKFSPSNEMWL